jgi:N-acetylmuramoyl-L-alanine amidase
LKKTKREIVREIRIISAVIVICVSAVFLCINSIASSKLVNNTQKIDTIIIDAGHGGFDAGATGVDKSLEKDINLEISLKLQAKFVKRNVNVKMTRTTDRALNDKYSIITSKKKSDMKNRLELIENTPNSLTICVHQNTYTSSKYSGAQMFYGVKNPQSEVIAEIIQKKFASDLQPENKRQIKKATRDLYLLKNSINPIVLVECGFISNKKEAELLNSFEYQNEVAEVIFSAVMEYLSL